MTGTAGTGALGTGAGTGGHRLVRRLGRLRPPPDVGPADEEHDPGEERDPGEGQDAGRHGRGDPGQARDAGHGQRHGAHQQQEGHTRHRQQPHDRLPFRTREIRTLLGTSPPPPDPVTTNRVTMWSRFPSGRGR